MASFHDSDIAVLRKRYTIWTAEHRREQKRTAEQQSTAEDNIV